MNHIILFSLLPALNIISFFDVRSKLIKELGPRFITSLCNASEKCNEGIKVWQHLKPWQHFCSG